MKHVLFLLLLVLFSSSAFALLGDWEGQTLYVSQGIEIGKAPDVEKFLWLVNPNDVDVQVFILPLGDLRNNVELLDNPVNISAHGRAQARFKLDMIHVGLYSGKLSGLFFAPGEKSNTTLSPNIIIDVFDVKNPPKTDKKKEQIIKQLASDDSKTIEEWRANTEQTDEDSSFTVNPNDNIEDNLNQVSADEETDSSIISIIKQIDSVRGERTTNPLIGLAIFAGIIIIGYSLISLIIKQ